MPTPTFKMRMQGGPADGALFETDVLNAEDLPPTMLVTALYPDGRPPAHEAGLYRLVSYSKLPSDVDTTHVFRGAQYDWKEADGGDR